MGEGYEIIYLIALTGIIIFFEKIINKKKDRLENIQNRQIHSDLNSPGIEYEIDEFRKADFLKQLKLHFLYKNLPFILLYISMAVACVAFSLIFPERLDLIFIAYFSFISYTLFFGYLFIKTLNTLRYFLKSKYLLYEDRLTMINHDRRKQIILIYSYTLFNTRIGTIVLPGKHNVRSLKQQLHLLSIPVNEHTIFIPVVTKNYEELISKLKANGNCC